MHNDNEFYQLAEKLLAEIAALHEAIDRHSSYQRERDKKADDAKNQVQPEPTPIRVKAEVNEPEDVSGKKNSRDHRRFVVEVLLMVGTWLAFGAAAYYAHIASGQREAMDNTLAEVRKQTSMLRQQMVGTQAAIVDPSIGGLDSSRGLIAVSVTNHGHITANHISVEVKASKRTIKDNRVLEQAQDNWGVEALPKDDQRQHTLQTAWGGTSMERPDTGPLPPGWPGSYTYVIVVKVTFDNGFDDIETREACLQWLPPAKFRDGGDTGGLSYSCQNIGEQIARALAHEKELDREAKQKQPAAPQ